METAWMLFCAGYSSSAPQVLAAHVKVLYQVLEDTPKLGEELVDILYSYHRPELLTLEAQARGTDSDAGRRMREFLYYVRSSILTWIVASTSRPRNALGMIDAARRHMGNIVASVFTAHLDPLKQTSQYSTLLRLTFEAEQFELGLGILAQRGPLERNLTLQIHSLPEALKRAEAEDARYRERHAHAEAKMVAFNKLKRIIDPICEAAPITPNR